MDHQKCTIPNCERPAVSRGVCRPHYARWWKDRNPDRVAEQKRRARRRRPDFVDRQKIADERKAAVQQLALPGVTQVQIAAQLGLKGSTVANILARLGISTRTPRTGAAEDSVPAPLYPAPGRCEACGKQRKLCIDHCHDTGEFRGWICGQCNRALGLAGDGIFEVRRLLSYLERAYARILSIPG